MRWASAPPRDRTSQESVAFSIAREVRSRLPLSGSIPGLDASVELSIRTQAIHNELLLAYVRACALVAAAIVAFLGWRRPGLVDGAAFYGAVVAVFAIGALAAIALLMALRRGWYHRRVRQLVPAGDALLIGLPVLLVGRDEGAIGGSMDPGVAALAGIACALLVFSGAVRLSRSAQRVATMLATLTWLFLAFALGTPFPIALFAAAVLIAIGFLGSRLDSMVRSVVAHEVAGTRMQSLYHDARSAIEAREEVLRIVAHDLRNPLSTIGMTAALMNDLPAEQRDDDKHLGIIARCTDSMNRIIQDLLEVARMEAGRLQIEPRPVVVSELLDRTCELMRPIAARSSIVLECTAPEADLVVYADHDRLLQVFSNLTGNAVKFTPPAGTITIRARRAGDSVKFSVLDTGPGVPPERVEKLFERFWQADSGDRRGIGLGLAIARSIVEAHGGRIGVDNRPTGGSEFWFTTPVAPGSSPEGSEIDGRLPVPDTSR